MSPGHPQNNSSYVDASVRIPLADGDQAKRTQATDPESVEPSAKSTLLEIDLAAKIKKALAQGAPVGWRQDELLHGLEFTITQGGHECGSAFGPQTVEEEARARERALATTRR